ncbi:class I SAM-dependent methyltransferase [Panacibacter ginsenosidivorans]|uniref:Class I SAM-dependent methyltransferase n=1 Tax=Panacibacter ginsenosidivorans TaxID=1813871 RepID=A0A5B8V6J1_9BACT|nr:class I SAM-dependent methyltransferase [Panacibacter ginsenosidivorans]QEC67097.1 class I SAM-dependent methyltransferase [Panacibacter ginsenosidivorans]
MASNLNIQNEFKAVSEKYDTQRKHLIPCFNDFYSIPLELSEEIEEVKNVLDVGAGTGLMSAFFYEKYPEASFTLVDLSNDMLAKAKERFEKQNENFTYLSADFSTTDFGEQQYDLVISGLAIHHLEHSLKQELFSKIYKALKPGGWFINADQVEGGTEEADYIYRDNWKKKVEQSPLTEDAKQSAYKRIQLDIMAPLNDQLHWLKDAGFEQANCYYQYFNFVVFAGRK